jgi:AraC-like DNA-binding protein
MKIGLRNVHMHVTKIKQKKFFLKAFSFSLIAVFLLIISISSLSFTLYKNALVNELITSNKTMLNKTNILISDTIDQVERLAYQQSLSTLRFLNEDGEGNLYTYKQLQQLSSELLNLKNANSYIHSAYIYINTCNLILTSNVGATPLKLFNDTLWLDNYKDSPETVLWLSNRTPYDDKYKDQQESLSRYYDDVNPVFTLIMPFFSYNNKNSGAIVINIYERAISKLLSDSDSDYETYLVNRSNTVIAGPGYLLNSSLPEDLFSIIEANQVNKGYERYMLDEEECIFVYSPSAFENNYIVSKIPLATILQPSNKILHSIYVISLIFLLIALLLVFLLLIYTYSPIKHLNMILKGNLSDLLKGNSDEVTGIQAAITNLIQDNRDLKALLENNRALIRHRLLTQILQGKLIASEDIDQRLKYMDIHFRYSDYSCIILRIGNSPFTYSPLAYEYELTRVNLFSLIQNCIPESLLGYAVDIDDTNICLIMNYNNDTLELSHILLRMCDRIRGELKASENILGSLSIGIGKIVNTLGSVPTSFQSAWAATDYATSVGLDQTINYSNISFFEPVAPLNFEKSKTELLAPIRIGNRETAIQVLNGIFKELEGQQVSLEFIQQYFMKVTGDILSLLYGLGVTLSKNSTTIISDYISLDNIPSIKMWVHEFIDNVCSQILYNRDNKNADLIDSILTYIKENYRRDLSLNQLADDVYMSVPYLSKIFKDYTHETFTEYLTSVRIEASKELLNNTNLKIIDISQDVGYTSVQSYIRAFKKITNMTPSEYRSSTVCSKFLNNNPSL